MKEERYFTNKYQQKIYFIEGYFDRFKKGFINYHKKVGMSKEQMGKEMRQKKIKGDWVIMVSSIGMLELQF